MSFSIPVSSVSSINMAFHDHFELVERPLEGEQPGQTRGVLVQLDQIGEDRHVPHVHPSQHVLPAIHPALLPLFQCTLYEYPAGMQWPYSIDHEGEVHNHVPSGGEVDVSPGLKKDDETPCEMCRRG
jgi:hypothetical protein